jgi:hypothetical protein
MLRLLRSAAAPLLPAVLRLLVGSAVLGAAVPAAAQSTVPATLVQIIDAARWATPSADPSGIGYWPARGTYLVSDGEIDEVSFFAGVNLPTAS